MKVMTAIAIAALAGSAAAEDTKTALEDALASVEPRVIAWRRDIHEHPELLNYRAGSFMAAADGLHITLEGEQTHGSSPWRGADPIYVAGQVLVALQGIPGRFLDITKGPAVITIGSIHGGVRGNIIPDKVDMMGTIRTFDAGEREELLSRLRDTVDGLAKAAGVQATVEITSSTPVTGNDPELLSRMMPTLEWAAGAGKVVEHPLITAAEDYSYYQQRIPGLFLMLGVNDPGVPAGASPSNHSPLFSPNEAALMTGVRALVGFAMDYASARWQPRSASASAAACPGVHPG